MLAFLLIRGPAAPLIGLRSRGGFSLAVQTVMKPSSATIGASRVQKGPAEAEKSGNSKWHIGHGSLLWQPLWRWSQSAAAKGKRNKNRKLSRSNRSQGGL